MSKLLQSRKSASSRKRLLVMFAAPVLVIAMVGVALLQLSRAAVETAKPADSIVDTMGFAGHIRYWNQDVFNNVFKPRFCESGVRHIRDGGGRGDTRFTSNLATLYRECGIKSTLVMDPRDGNKGTDGPEMIQKVGADAVAVLEGPNEWDLAKGRTYAGRAWPENMRIYMNELWSSVKNHPDPKVRAVKIATPTIAMQQVSGAEIGQVKCDLGAIHPYPGSPNKPDDKLDTVWIPRHAQQMCAGKPWISTESGYCNDNSASGCSNQGGISRRTTAKYVLRHYLEYYIRGAYIDHWYNLSIDNWSGILENNGTPKPAFYAVKSFTTLMKDPGASFTPGSLEYSISGGSADLKKQLFQKRDGRFYLVTWLNVHSTAGGHNNHTDKDTAQPITISFGKKMTSVRAFYPTFDGTAVKENYTGVTSISTTARDQVVIYEITPEGVTAPPPGPAPSDPITSPNPNPTPTPTNPSPGTEQPDLIVTGISGSPANPAPGTPVTFSAVVKNQGTAPVPAGTVIGVLFHVNGVKTSWSDTFTGGLAPGASVTVTANTGENGVKTWTAASGSHQIQAHVDDINRIAETDENNNILVKPLSGTSTPSQAAGDLNGDGTVGITDLSILLSKWGTGDTQADLNKDGTVSITDLSILLTGWRA